MGEARCVIFFECAFRTLIFPLLWQHTISHCVADLRSSSRARMAQAQQDGIQQFGLLAMQDKFMQNLRTENTH